MKGWKTSKDEEKLLMTQMKIEKKKALAKDKGLCKTLKTKAVVQESQNAPDQFRGIYGLHKRYEVNWCQHCKKKQKNHKLTL